MTKQELLQMLKMKRNPDLAIFEATQEMKRNADKIIKEEVDKKLDSLLDEIVARVSKEMNKGTDNSTLINKIVSNVLTDVKGEAGLDGNTPIVGKDFFTQKEKEEFKNDIFSRIAQPTDGKDADEEKIFNKILNKIPIPKDGKTPIAGIDFELPKDGKVDEEKIIKEIIKKMPPPKDTMPIFNKIISKIESYKEKVEETIKGLESKIETQRRTKAKMGGGGLGPVTEFSFTGDGVTTAFTLPGVPTANGKAVWAYSDGQWMQLNTHYTVSGLTLSTTYVPENGAIIEGFIIT